MEGLPGHSSDQMCTVNDSEHQQWKESDKVCMEMVFIVGGGDQRFPPLFYNFGHFWLKVSSHPCPLTLVKALKSRNVLCLPHSSAEEQLSSVVLTGDDGAPSPKHLEGTSIRKAVVESSAVSLPTPQFHDFCYTFSGDLFDRLRNFSLNVVTVVLFQRPQVPANTAGPMAGAVKHLGSHRFSNAPPTCFISIHQPTPNRVPSH